MLDSQGTPGHGLPGALPAREELGGYLERAPHYRSAGGRQAEHVYTGGMAVRWRLVLERWRRGRVLYEYS